MNALKQKTSILQQIIDELKEAKKVCPRCNGYKWIVSPEWEQYHELWNSTVKMLKEKYPDKPSHLIERQADAELDHLLPRDVDEEIPCPKCEGAGYILTDEAFELICLLRQLL